MVRAANHSQEHTGNTTLDRIQANVREAIDVLKRTVAALTTLRTATGIGASVVTLSDSNATWTMAQLSAAHIVLEGTLSAGRTIRVPRATDAGAYSRWFYNNTTGGFSVTFANDDGSVALATSTFGKLLVYETYGPELWT